jgi:3-methyladenine DNA glycosylase AlkC
MSDIIRKGARSIKEIPNDILVQLNGGQIQSANLVEWLAVDQRVLLGNFLRNSGRIHYLNPILGSIDALKKQSVITINAAIGDGLSQQSALHNDFGLHPIMASHTSDSIRCWAAYALGANPHRELPDLLEQMLPFAADNHFGVREISWMVSRPRIAASLSEGIEILRRWTQHSDENIRRFASEATRPRGVWCAHIQDLKESPALGLPILEPLRSDKAKYVQDSVGNWLNDASKTQPQFVIDLCQRWAHESDTRETAYIVKKALRSIQL